MVGVGVNFLIFTVPSTYFYTFIYFSYFYNTHRSTGRILLIGVGVNLLILAVVLLPLLHIGLAFDGFGDASQPLLDNDNKV